MNSLARYLTHTLRNWNVPILAIAVALGLTMCCSSVFAQSGAGSIQGTVTDPTGAVVTGASINVVQQGTNATFNTKSSEIGFYQVPALFVGNYVVTVTAPGMKTYSTSIQLLVAQAATINPIMTAGAVSERVEVAADAVQLTTTDNGTISQTLENDRISQLPMNGRVLVALAGMTTPGLEGGQRANGLMGEALEYVADGVPLSNRQFGGMNQSSAQAPDPDAVQEVRIETTNTGAQYSEPGTAIITTKSGTNRIHGALFETARNNAIGIAKARQNPANFAAPHLVRNEYGASIGGPIVLPKIYHGKDKSFWFLAYEKYSLASFASELVSVPTMAMRGGDFSGLINSSGVLQVLYDPRTTGNAANNYARTPFAGNVIPIGMQSPTAKIIADITAKPNTADNPLVTSNLQAPNINNTQIPTITFRLDHTFNENNRTFLRYTSNNQTQHTLRNYPFNSPATVAADGFPDAASGIAYNPSATFAAGLGFTHVFSPTFFSETILGQQWFSQHNYAGGTPFANFEKQLGLPNNFGEGGFPNYGSNLITPYGGTQFIYGLSQIVTNLDENLTKTVGKHQMNFGGRYRHERFGYLPDEFSDTVTFAGNQTGLYDTTTGANYGKLANTGFPDADQFLGAANSFSVNHEPPYAHFHDMEFDAYFQDNLHASRNLTLNLGVRWESHPAGWIKGGVMEGFDLKNDALVLASTPADLIARGFTTQTIIDNLRNNSAKIETSAQAGLPEKLMRDYNLTFSPRVGIAYTPFGGKRGTVLRGAYGRYIYPIPTRSTFKNVQQNSPYTATYSQDFNNAAQSPDGLANYYVRNPQIISTGVNTANVVNSSTANSLLPGINIYSLNPIQPPDYVTQINGTIEQPLKGNSALRLTALWSHGTNLDQQYVYNKHLSQYAWEMQTGTTVPKGGPATIGTNQFVNTSTGPYDKISWGDNMIQDQKSGWSNDTALQATYQRLYHKGVAYQINYVWSKPFRLGGNYFRDGNIYPKADYVNSGLGTMASYGGSVTTPNLGPALPAGAATWGYSHAFDRFQNYHIDVAIPKQHISWNGIVDMPVGRGKHFLGNANRFVDELLGGFQVAGDGNLASNDFAIMAPTSSSSTTTNWGAISPIKKYKHAAKITDCRSGVCRPAYEWFNGYIAPSVVNAAVKGVSGLPSGWVPATTPINNTPPPDITKTCKQQVCTLTQANYGNNNVTVTLADGTPDNVAFSPGQQGTHPYSQKVLDGPINYTIDLSVFKVFPITESVRLRFNVDAFNALNMQGYNNPNLLDGVQLLTSSFNTPRQLQFTLRLQF
jgi:hypothetical protein